MTQLYSELNKSKDLEKLVSGVDITPTMYNNAVDKYQALGKFFEENGIECDIYPQGSFALGTVVRPLKTGKQSDYDLDFICLVKNSKKETDPEKLKNLIGDLLKRNKIYCEKLTEYEKCWTLNYSEINNVGFNIDIIPSINDTPYSMDLNTSNFIFITDKNFENGESTWIKSNPKDYTNWFLSINSMYPQHSERKEFMESFQNSVEELPDLFERTSLQRVIQILKLHRDYYYTQRKKEKKKVISAIITTLCAKIAHNTNFTLLNTEELLQHIINELKIYSQYNLLLESEFDQRYKDKKVIKKSYNKWKIENPVNPEDNLADQWNEDSEKPVLFFDWINCINEDFIKSKDTSYIYSLNNVFGESYVYSRLDTTKYRVLLEDKKELIPAKPWRNNE